MLEKELQMIKEAEEECRAILIRANEESAEIIQHAAKEAEGKLRDITKESHKEGEKILTDLEKKLIKIQEEFREELSEEVQGVKQKGLLLVDSVSDKIFERMWIRGNS